MGLNYIGHDGSYKVYGYEVHFQPALIKVRHGAVVKGRTVVRSLTQHLQLDVSEEDRKLACYIMRNGQVELRIGANGEHPRPPANLFYKLFYGEIPAGKSITGGDFTIKCAKPGPKQADPEPQEPQEPPAAPEATQPPQEPQEPPQEPDTAPDEEPTDEEIILEAIEALLEDGDEGDLTSSGMPSVTALRDELEARGLTELEVNAAFRDLWWGKYKAANPDK